MRLATHITFGKKEMKHRKTICACLLLTAAGCVSQIGYHAEDNRGDLVAATFAKAAAYAYSPDFIGRDVEETFTRDEVRVLKQHLPALQSMIETTLGLQDSAGGARLAAHFSLANTNILRLIRCHILEPRNCYGWEGPDYSIPENYLTDNQYPYSIQYLDAMESLAGKPIWQTITLQPRELQMIQGYASNEVSEFHHWALWMQRKLRIKERPNHTSDGIRQPADGSPKPSM